jgi:hypothetical protein
MLATLWASYMTYSYTQSFWSFKLDTIMPIAILVVPCGPLLLNLCVCGAPFQRLGMDICCAPGVFGYGMSCLLSASLANSTSGKLARVIFSLTVRVSKDSCLEN